ncbi:MAG: hypothetical protein ABH859_04185 [Pseudomonadota bacterium]
MESKGRRRLEIVIVVLVIIAAIVVLGIKNHLAAKSAKEEALISQLRAVRTATALYLEINRVLPPTLKDLADKDYTLGNRTNSYLSGIKVDAEGYPVDAFGKRFNYNPKNGKIWPEQEEYSDW